MSELRGNETYTDVVLPVPSLREVVTVKRLFSLSDVRKILNNRNNSTRQDRIFNLALYAFGADSDGEFAPLPESADYMNHPFGPWLSGWLKSNEPVIKNLIKDKKAYDDFIKETDYFGTRYEWAAQANRIKNLFPVHEEPIQADLAVRMIIKESLDELNSA